ncbi:MAG: hypothetical protein LBN95_12995 [Prevotellaceae bacterium]|nr:hypothetical protein [Prevotellaceae bacterium]
MVDIQLFINFLPRSAVRSSEKLRSENARSWKYLLRSKTLFLRSSKKLKIGYIYLLIFFFLLNIKKLNKKRVIGNAFNFSTACTIPLFRGRDNGKKTAAPNFKRSRLSAYFF